MLLCQSENHRLEVEGRMFVRVTNNFGYKNSACSGKSEQIGKVSTKSLKLEEEFKRHLWWSGSLREIQALELMTPNQKICAIE